jgi:hypothetical protein
MDNLYVGKDQGTKEKWNNFVQPLVIISTWRKESVARISPRRSQSTCKRIVLPIVFGPSIGGRRRNKKRFQVECKRNIIKHDSSYSFVVNNSLQSYSAEDTEKTSSMDMKIISTPCPNNVRVVEEDLDMAICKTELSLNVV